MLIAWLIVVPVSFLLPGSPWAEVPPFARRALQQSPPEGLWEQFESIGNRTALFDATVQPALMALLVAVIATLLRASTREALAAVITFAGWQFLLDVSTPTYRISALAVFSLVLFLFSWLANTRRKSRPSSPAV